MAWLPIALRIPIAKGLAVLLYRLVPSRRKVAQTNIRLCFADKSPQEQEALVKATFFSNTLTFFETAHAWCRSTKGVNYELKGLEHLKQAQANGQGVLLLSGHFGPIDISGPHLGSHVDFASVYRRHDSPLFNYFMTRARERFSIATFARRDMKSQLRHLRRGGVIWYAPDQDYGRKASVFAPFFGVQTATITMTSKLAKAGQAVVVPISGYRKADHKSFVIVIEPAMNIPSGDDIADSTVINQWLERRISEHPEQYLWLHRRFKTRPEGEPPIY